MAPRRKLLYDRECHESLLSPIHQKHEWVCGRSLFDPEFLDQIIDHTPSPLDYIRQVCRGWCHLDDWARQDNSICDTLLPSIAEGETLKYSTISDFRSLIRKIWLGKVSWVDRNYRGSSSFSVRERKWESTMEHCLSNYHAKINVVGMADALRCFVGSFNKHHAMVAEAISRWCPNINTFLCQYD